ncbi:MAG: hypothetical protein JSR67_09305 [Proteobacteria bacterium]|nr:hypothetical protein [Pseudomonadota bacterium]
MRAALTASLRELGPYATIGLLVPGGSVIALSMWAARHGGPASVRRVLLVAAAAGAALLTQGTAL